MEWYCSTCHKKMRSPKYMAYNAAQRKPKLKTGNWVLGFSRYDKRFYAGEYAYSVFCSIQCFIESIYKWLDMTSREPWSK